jgi:hypothetical protein
MNEAMTWWRCAVADWFLMWQLAVYGYDIIDE